MSLLGRLETESEVENCMQSSYWNRLSGSVPVHIWNGRIRQRGSWPTARLQLRLNMGALGLERTFRVFPNWDKEALCVTGSKLHQRRAITLPEAFPRMWRWGPVRDLLGTISSWESLQLKGRWISPEETIWTGHCSIQHN